MLRKLNKILFVILLGLICGFALATTRIYYWCISPDCFVIWASLMNINIHIGGMK